MNDAHDERPSAATVEDLARARALYTAGRATPDVLATLARRGWTPGHYETLGQLTWLLHNIDEEIVRAWARRVIGRAEDVAYKGVSWEDLLPWIEIMCGSPTDDEFFAMLDRMQRDEWWLDVQKRWQGLPYRVAAAACAARVSPVEAREMLEESTTAQHAADRLRALAGLRGYRFL